MSIEFDFLRVVSSFSKDNRDKKAFLDFCNLLNLVCAFVSSTAALFATIMSDLASYYNVSPNVALRLQSQNFERQAQLIQI